MRRTETQLFALLCSGLLLLQTCVVELRAELHFRQSISLRFNPSHNRHLQQHSIVSPSTRASIAAVNDAALTEQIEAMETATATASDHHASIPTSIQPQTFTEDEASGFNLTSLDSASARIQLLQPQYSSSTTWQQQCPLTHVYESSLQQRVRRVAAAYSFDVDMLIQRVRAVATYLIDLDSEHHRLLDGINTFLLHHTVMLALRELVIPQQPIHIQPLYPHQQLNSRPMLRDNTNTNTIHSNQQTITTTAIAADFRSHQVVAIIVTFIILLIHIVFCKCKIMTLIHSIPNNNNRTRTRRHFNFHASIDSINPSQVKSAQAIEYETAAAEAEQQVIDETMTDSPSVYSASTDTRNQETYLDLDSTSPSDSQHLNPLTRRNCVKQTPTKYQLVKAIQTAAQRFINKPVNKQDIAFIISQINLR